MYLGPGRSFDDEDLEYLNNKDVEEQKSLQRVGDDAPPSPLIVDSVSGIYLGFEDKEEEDSETEDADEKAGSEDTDPDDVSLGTDVKVSSKMFGFFKRKQSKYEVNSEPDLGLDAEDGHCFKFIRKVWRKAEVCQ